MVQDIIIYPIAGGSLVNVLSIKDIPDHGTVYHGPWMEPVTGEAISKLFGGWQP